MKNSSKQSLAILLLVAACVLSLSCGVPARLAANGQQETPAPSQPAVNPLAASAQPAVEAVPGDDPSPSSDPLDHLLGLRSIRFHLTTQQVDGALRSMEGAIDAAGNMHLKFVEPPDDLAGMPAGFQAAPEAPQTELFVLGGRAYQPDEQNPDWKTTPIDENFASSLSQQLHGMESPALWLNLLPVGSIIPAGSETVGGFAANRYTVQGQVSGAMISGSIWKDPQSNALVRAELHIPAALLSPADAPQAGELRITLTAEKAAVDPIALP